MPSNSYLRPARFLPVAAALVAPLYAQTPPPDDVLADGAPDPRVGDGGVVLTPAPPDRFMIPLHSGA